MGFAENTTVPVEKSRAEIEGVVRKYGASQFSSGWDGAQGGLLFVMNNKRIKFVVDIPGEDAAVKAWGKLRTRQWNRKAEWLAAWVAQEERRRWRCLLLAIKAKLETVTSGIATFEEEFLAHIVTDNGQTVFERLRVDTAMSARMLPAIEQKG